MNTIDLIITNSINKIEKLLASGEISIYELEPEFFIGKEGAKMQRKHRKTALEVAYSLQRQDILDIMEKYRDAGLEKERGIELIRVS